MVSFPDMLGIPNLTNGIPSSEVTNFFVNTCINRGLQAVIVQSREACVVGYLHDHGNYCSDPVAYTMVQKINDSDFLSRKLTEIKTRNNKKLWLKTRRSRITASIAHLVSRS